LQQLPTWRFLDEQIAVGSARENDKTAATLQQEPQNKWLEPSLSIEIQPDAEAIYLTTRTIQPGNKVSKHNERRAEGRRQPAREGLEHQQQPAVVPQQQRQ
jgi:hypothetical protein